MTGSLKTLKSKISSIILANLFGLGLILVLNLYYFSSFEYIFKYNKKGIIAMFLSIGIQFLLYFILSKVIYKLRYKSILIGLYLCFLTICFLISSTGKFYWREIPTVNLIFDTVLQDFSLLNKSPFPWQMIGCIVFLILSLIIFVNFRLQKNNQITIPNTILYVISLFILINYSLLYYKNITHNKWAYRDIIGEDPVLGIFKNARNNPNNYVNAISLDTNYNKLILKPDAPNVIIIICDALRNDHLSMNGYNRPTSPFLDSIVQNSCNSYISPFHTSSCTSTFCGVISTLYGVNYELLKSSNLGIHDLLHSKGYKSSFILCGSHRSYYNLTDYYGKHIDNYFESKDIKSIDSSIPSSSDRTLIAYLNSPKFNYNISEKQFMYFHVMAPHEISYKENIVYAVSKENKNQDRINDYDNGVIQADNILREIYYNLKNKGILENAVLIITSDHGQALNQTKEFEHFGHGFWPIGETINIPLIIIDSQNSYSKNYSTKIDLYPTITERCFVNPAIINSHLMGVSLLQNAPLLRRTFHLGELRNYGEPSVAIIEATDGIPLFKYLYNPTNKKSYIYDLKISKNEKTLINNDSLLDHFKKEHIKYLKNN